MIPVAQPWWRRLLRLPQHFRVYCQCGMRTSTYTEPAALTVVKVHRLAALRREALGRVYGRVGTVTPGGS